MSRHQARWMGALILALVLSSGKSHGANCQTQGSGAAELRPGVVVDPGAGRIYLMTPDKTVEAITVDKGETLFKLDRSAKPLTVKDGLLVCQEETADSPGILKLVVLNGLEEGREVSATTVELPDNVEARIVHDLSRRFDASAVIHREDAFISWEYQVIPVRGMPDDEGAEEDARSQVRGTIRLDLASGSASAVPTEEIPEEVLDAAPKALTNARGAATDPSQRLSIDGKHTLKSARTGNAGEWDRYQWSIVDNASGKQIGQVRSNLSQSAFVVVGTRLVFESRPFTRRTDSGVIAEPLSIHAVDLQSGQRVWNRPVRDNEYQGDYPP